MTALPWEGQRWRSLQTGREWQPPTLVMGADPDATARLDALLATGRIRSIVDPLPHIAADLYDLHRAGPHGDADARARYVGEFTEHGQRYGCWVHFPWAGELVRYPTPEDHRALQTFRNRDLITGAEQRRMGSARIAVIGLSVGSTLVDQLVQLGIGGGFLLADGDVLRPTNLNRLRATMREVGMSKLHVQARKISEANPFVDQVHLDGHYDEDQQGALDGFRPDVIIEEVDDLAVKARLRRYAARRRVPLLMVSDVGERSVVDVERHDLGPTTPFNGVIPLSVTRQLLQGTLPEKAALITTIRLVGLRNLSARLLRSAVAVGTELAGNPQLGSTANSGAALASVAVRELLTGGRLPSGRYVHDPRRTLRLGRQAGAREAWAAVRGVAARR